MVEFTGLGGGVVSFSAVFFDGERKIEIGNVAIFPGLDFKSLQDFLSQKIGIAPHQFSVHLASPNSARKVPISDKTNFAAVARHKGWLFVVVLKRSRAHRRRKNDAVSTPDAKASRNNHPPENVTLLRRNGRELGFGRGRAGEDSDAWAEDFLKDMGCYGGSDLNPILAPSRVDAGSFLGRRAAKKVVVCEDCMRGKDTGPGRATEFHSCVNDEVVYGFRTLAGPVARPW